MIGVQFEGVDSNPIPVKDLLTVTNLRTGTAAGNTVDQIQVFNGSAYDIYYYRTNVGWCKKGEQTVTEDTVKPGDAVFFRKGSLGTAGTATISGQVSTTDEFTVSLAKGSFVLMTNPWPVPMKIADIGKYYTNAKTGNAAGNTIDQIQVWDSVGAKYDIYYNRTGVGFCAKGESEATTAVINPGEGFFFRKGSLGTAGVMTLTKPTGL